MRTLITLLFITATSTGFAQATEADRNAFFGHNGQFNLQALEGALTGETENLRGAPCSDLNLTDEQKQAIGSAFIAHKKATIQDEADFKIAQIDYIVALMDTTGDKAKADAAAAALATTTSATVSAHLGFVNELLFTVLTLEQRRPALKCMKAMKDHMKHHHLKKMCEKHGKGPHTPVQP